MYVTLEKSIESYDLHKFQSIIDIINNEKYNVKRYPEAYKDCLNEIEALSKKHKGMTKELIAEFNYPLHPSFVISKLHGMKNANGQTLLLTACKAISTYPKESFAASLFIDSLLQMNFSPYEADQNGQTSISFLLN